MSSQSPEQSQLQLLSQRTGLRRTINGGPLKQNGQRWRSHGGDERSGLGILATVRTAGQHLDHPRHYQVTRRHAKVTVA